VETRIFFGRRENQNIFIHTISIKESKEK